MTSPQEKEGRTIEVKGRPKTKTAKIIIIIVLLVAAAFAARAILGTNKKTVAQAPAEPIVVLYTAADSDLVAQSEYIGKVEAIQSVLVKPQVAGEIMAVHFKEGSIVRAGQPLFSIDSRQYQATVDLRKAELAQAEATLDRAAKYYNRLKAADKRSVSASDLDTAESDVRQSQAAVSQAKAALKLAQIDLAHTNITAPISGQIGAANFTKGNYVTASSGPLTTIKQMDPIRVAFAMPDRDYLDQLESYKKSGKSVYKTTLLLANGKTFPADGERDFEDNEIDQETGTLLMRLRFQNSTGLLIPGAMVRIKATPIEHKRMVVIPQTAVLTDTEGDYVYVVGSDGIAQQRRVTLGAEIDTMRQVKNGLNPGDRVVVQGVQALRPGVKVRVAESAEGSGKTPSDSGATSPDAGAASTDNKPAKEGN